MKNFCQALRACLGGFALALGTLGLLSFAAGVPLSIFGAHFFAGLGYREGAQPTPAQLQAAVNRELNWSVIHRLLPLFVGSLALIGDGFTRRLKKRNPSREMHIPCLSGWLPKRKNAETRRAQSFRRGFEEYGFLCVASRPLHLGVYFRPEFFFLPEAAWSARVFLI